MAKNFIFVLLLIGACGKPVKEVSPLASSEGGKVLGTESSKLQLEHLPRLRDLIGGDVVTADEYPGVFYTSQGNSRCTGTLVGPRVVATASHCVSNGGSLTLKHNGVAFTGKCERAKEYNGNATADWALCLLAEPIKDAIAETVNTDATRLELGKEITLMGYGCVKSGGGGGNDGKLRKGSAPIKSLPSGKDYDIVTKGKSALCFGDSGGPSFVVVGEKRYQTGINSRGDISTTSYLSSLHVEPAKAFYKAFGDKNKVTICGIHADATGCR